MQVRTIIGAQYAYVCIREGTRTLDLLLSPGKSTKSSMRESVAEMREQEAALHRRADFIEAALLLV